jgi:hypothetical protein
LLLPLLLEPLFDGELGLPLGVEVEPEEAPPEVVPEELPLAADEGLLEALLLPEPALWSRLQPASARARDAARMASSLMNPP